MSALLVDDLIVPVPVRPQPRHWRHVERGPLARPQVVATPCGRPEGVAAPEVRAAAPARPVVRPARASAHGSWQLTDRGVAVVVVFFLALLATAAVVLVGSFFSVSDAPFPAASNDAAVLVAHGR
jgi:hypothetical protein